MEINTKNIDDAVRSLRRLNDTDLPIDNASFLLPISERVLNREIYRGKGRPRKSDYSLKKIDWSTVLREYESGTF